MSVVRFRPFRIDILIGTAASRSVRVHPVRGSRPQNLRFISPLSLEVITQELAQEQWRLR